MSLLEKKLQVYNNLTLNFPIKQTSYIIQPQMHYLNLFKLQLSNLLDELMITHMTRMKKLK